MVFSNSLIGSFSYSIRSFDSVFIMAEYSRLKSHTAFKGRKAALEPSSFGSGGIIMSKALTVLNQFKNDEDGAALIEYTVLLGLMLVAVVATIGLVGTWVSGQWTALNAGL